MRLQDKIFVNMLYIFHFLDYFNFFSRNSSQTVQMLLYSCLGLTPRKDLIILSLVSYYFVKIVKTVSNINKNDYYTAYL